MKITLVPGQLSRDEIVAIAHKEGYDGHPRDVGQDLPVFHTHTKEILFVGEEEAPVDEHERIEDPTPTEVRKAAKGMVEDDEDNEWTKVNTKITMELN